MNDEDFNPKRIVLTPNQERILSETLSELGADPPPVGTPEDVFWRDHARFVASLDARLPMGQRDRPGFIYVIEAIGASRVKLGWTARDARDRLMSLQTSSPFPLRIVAVIVGTMREERALHARFHALRIMPNSEWFHLRGELEAFVRSLPIQLGKSE